MDSPRDSAASAVPEAAAVPGTLATPAAASIRGIVPPMVTPLASPDTIDELGLQRLVEHLIEGGVHGLFILGTTGEGPSLPQTVRRDLIMLTCKFVDQRVPVMVGITESVPAMGLELGRIAAGEGATATVLAPPYYFPLTQQELGDYAEGLAAELELPLMLYNMPGLTKVWYEVETLRRLTQVESIIGLKDSSGDLRYFEAAVELKRLRPDWSLLVGPEHLLSATLQLGGDGGVNGGAHLFPQWFVDCYESHQRGALAEAARYQAAIEALQACYAVGGDDPQRFLKVPKHALALRGICSDRLAPPLQPLAPQQIEQLRALIEQLESSTLPG
ncbi:dihydrodipicolinate synthase family protein [Candidatus Laterigemmans baculatus]|uniref:dihydrodipicolinate synthase family protein n=1 Tax=Candidatus Laterigemmans baculatus TaxID=2770505 RepID=UPI0013DB8A77|nr:dihydrodipicolinate synthase family protein [Candidatus Laterigemmans baculatus]